VKQCVQNCPKDPPPPPPPPPLDPGCNNRSITGTIHCTINQPPVNAHETTMNSVLFAPGDVVTVTADGCVQTGGHGSTWKRYVNPSGPSSDALYHGLIRIPTGTKDGALVRINTVIGRQLQVTGQGVPVDQLVLHLGYEDGNGDYGDNGYYSHDDGTEDQCKSSGSNYGGPAYAKITIFRGTTVTDPGSRFAFDVDSTALDANGLPYNPQWTWQVKNPGQIPSTTMCHNFSRRDSTLGIPDEFMSPYFADCTDQADTSSVDTPIGINATICNYGTIPYFGDTFAGHVNWFPVTLEGRAGWGDHGSDDDYTFTWHADQGDPLSVNGRSGLHVEFDSDETIDNFHSQEWDQLRDAVDAGQSAKGFLSLCDAHQLQCTAEQRAAWQKQIDGLKAMFDGHFILTGMFGLDGEHGMKAEMHPVYAMSALRNNFENSPGDEVWLMFVRNQGDEGYCSSNVWDAGFEDYTVKLPWRAGMTSVDVNWDKTNFVGTDGTSGPTVQVLPPPVKDAGVYVSFHLGAPVHSSYIFDPGASMPFINGALHLVWTGPGVRPFTTATANPVGVTRPVVPKPITGTGGAAEGRPEVGADESEDLIGSAIEKLPEARRVEVEKARLLRGTKAPVLHPLPKAGTVGRMSGPPSVARRGKPHAIKAGPAARKAARDGAQVKALCAATNNAPQGLPPAVCRHR
jgi:hypothetical protein